MKQDQIEEGRLSQHGQGLGTVTEDMVMHRAREVAVINGRGGNHMLDSDIEQARRELQGNERLNPVPTAGESLAESERWDLNRGSQGRRARTIPVPDEQTYAEKLVEEGVADAEHDQAVEATREAIRRDKQR